MPAPPHFARTNLSLTVRGMAPQPWMRSARTISIPAQTNPSPAANGETAPTNSPPARPNPTTLHVTSRSPSPRRPPSAALARPRPLLPVRPRSARAPVPARHLLHHPAVCLRIVTTPSTLSLTKPRGDDILLGSRSYPRASDSSHVDASPFCTNEPQPAHGATAPQPQVSSARTISIPAQTNPSPIAKCDSARTNSRNRSKTVTKPKSVGPDSRPFASTAPGAPIILLYVACQKYYVQGLLAGPVE